MKQESAANAWFAPFHLFVIPNVCNYIPLWNSYLVGAKRQIGDRAQGFLNFSDRIQDVATSCDCWYQQAQHSNRIPNNSFISSLHTQAALACVIHNAASSLPLYMNKLVRAVRLLTYFGGSSIWTFIRHRLSRREFLVVCSLSSCEIPKLYLVQVRLQQSGSPAVEWVLRGRDPLARVSIGSLSRRPCGLDQMFFKVFTTAYLRSILVLFSIPFPFWRFPSPL